jgi:t-SNARE complex subunit (syntaxin)
MCQIKELAYAEERSAAFETIESTVQELASIFTQMGTLLAQQKEQVGRLSSGLLDVDFTVLQRRVMLTLGYKHRLDASIKT